jgi:hypothetical protein
LIVTERLETTGGRESAQSRHILGKKGVRRCRVPLLQECCNQLRRRGVSHFHLDARPPLEALEKRSDESFTSARVDNKGLGLWSDLLSLSSARRNDRHYRDQRAQLGSEPHPAPHLSILLKNSK